MQLTRNEIFEKLTEILLLEDESLEEILKNMGEQADLRSDLGLNSVSLLYLVISVEETFDIRFDDVSVTDFALLGDVVNYISAKL